MPREPHVTIKLRRSSPPSEFEIRVEGDGDVYRAAMELAQHWMETAEFDATVAVQPDAGSSPVASNGPGAVPREESIDVEWLRERLPEANYEERAVLIAYAAIKAGLEGVDTDLAEWVCKQLEISKRPKAWRSTFHGASSNGYLEKSGVYGVWAPTEAGVHLAQDGLRRTGPRPRTRGGGAAERR